MYCLFKPGIHQCFVLLHEFFGIFIRIGTVFLVPGHESLKLSGVLVAEVVQKFIDFGFILFKVFTDYGVYCFFAAKYAFGIVKVLKILAAEHPVGRPACYDNPILVFDRAVERCGHGCTGAFHKFKFIELVLFHGIF